MSDDPQAAPAAGIAGILDSIAQYEQLNDRLVRLAEHTITVSMLTGDREALAAWRTALDALHQTRVHLAGTREALTQGDVSEAQRYIILARQSHAQAMAHVRTAGPVTA